MKIKKILCLSLFLTLPAVYASAALEITPRISVEEKLDDNIYLDNSDETESLITTLKLGAELSSSKPGHLLSLNFGNNFLFYSEDPDKNNDNQSAIVLKARNKFASGLSLHINNTYMETSAPASSELTERLERVQNDAEMGIGYVISPKTSLQLKGSYKTHDYDDDNIARSYNRDSIDGELKAYYHFLPKTSLFLQYRYWEIDYEKADRDNTNDIVSLGIKSRLSGKITSLVTGGYQMRVYDSEDIEDFETPVGRLELDYKMFSKTSLNLRGDYSLVESFYDINNYYSHIGAKLAIEQLLSRGLSLNAAGGYRLNSYPEKTSTGTEMKEREDDILVAEFGVNYAMQRWLTCFLGYEYRDRSSTHETYDYTRNLVKLRLAAKFD